MSYGKRGVPEATIEAAILAAYAGVEYRPVIHAVCAGLHCDPQRGCRIERAMIEDGRVPRLPDQRCTPGTREKLKAAWRRRVSKAPQSSPRGPSGPAPAPVRELTRHQRLVAYHMARERRIGL